MHSDTAKTCAMLGQKDHTVLFDHYRSLVRPADAKKFYELTPAPSAASEKIVPLHATR